MNQPLRRLAGQVLIAGFPAGPVPTELLDAIRDDGLGGVILFSRNLGSMTEIWQLNRSLRAASPVESPLIAVDQEGGRVARLKSPVVTLPPAARFGERDDPALTQRAGAVLGRQLAALGFSVNFAPVLDVFTNPDNRVIGDRAFGREPERVIRHGLAFAAGLEDAGVLACGKHFPGHGDTLEDSHFELPSLAHGSARLEQVELAPFRAAKALPMWMTAHVLFPALDGERPATLSPRMIRGLLREEIGYEGLVVSDDLEMKAVARTWPAGEAAVLAIEAGCDALLVCSRVDLFVAARDALALAAERSESFRLRLEEAARRTREARRAVASLAPAADEAALEAALSAPEVRALEAELT